MKRTRSATTIAFPESERGRLRADTTLEIIGVTPVGVPSPGSAFPPPRNRVAVHHLGGVHRLRRVEEARGASRRGAVDDRALEDQTSDDVGQVRGAGAGQL